MPKEAKSIKQHEPLRTPQGWKDQEVALIAQLERIFDDLYKRFGRISVKDLGDALRSVLVFLDEHDEIPASQLPLATNSGRGGIKIGYTENDKKYAVKLDDEKAYAEVPWTDTKNTAGAADKKDTKLYLVGAKDQTVNPETSSNEKCYVGANNCLYSNNSKVVDFSLVHNGTDYNTAGQRALDAATGYILGQNYVQALREIAMLAVKSGDNWRLSSGVNADVGDFISKQGILGVATAAITGGSTNIVEGTNWTKVNTGGLNALQARKADKSNTVTDVSYDAVARKIKKTINGTTTDVLSVSDLGAFTWGELANQ